MLPKTRRHGTHIMARLVVFIVARSKLASADGRRFLFLLPYLLLFHTSFGLSTNDGDLDFLVGCNNFRIGMIQVAQIPTPSYQHTILQNKERRCACQQTNERTNERTIVEVSCDRVTLRFSVTYLYKDTMMDRYKIKVERVDDGPQFPMLHHGKP